MAQIKHKDQGFSLIEVMIAMVLFSTFVVVFVSSQGSNLLDSVTFKEELSLMQLAQMKVDELVVNPPEFRESLTSASKETKTFEDFPDYQYELEIKKFEIPDITKLQGNEESDDNAQNQLKQRIFEQIKENMEKLVWQISVTVTHKESKRNYTISTWLLNEDAKVQFTTF